MKKTVAFITETAELGGGELNLLTILRNMPRQYFLPIVILPKQGPLADRLEAIGVKYTIVPLDNTYSTSFFLGKYKLPNFAALIGSLWGGAGWANRLKVHLCQIQPDIVHTLSLWAHVFGGLAACWASIPLVWHVQHIVSPSAGLGSYRSAFTRVRSLLPDHTIAISNPVAEQFGSSKKQNVTIIDNALDEKWFGASSFTLPQSDATLKLGTVARLTRWKGHDVHLQVAARLRDLDIPFCWRIAGTETLGEMGYQAYLQGEIERLKLTKQVELCGWVSDMQHFYADIDVLVHLPIEPEPFGLTLAEGLASGLPVITTTGGGMSSHVSAADGKVVDIYAIEPVINQLIEWQTNTAKRQYIGKKSRDYASIHFRPKAFTEALLNVYRSIL